MFLFSFNFACWPCWDIICWTRVSCYVIWCYPTERASLARTSPGICQICGINLFFVSHDFKSKWASMSKVHLYTTSLPHTHWNQRGWLSEMLYQKAFDTAFSYIVLSNMFDEFLMFPFLWSQSIKLRVKRGQFFLTTGILMNNWPMNDENRKYPCLGKPQTIIIGCYN